MMKKGLYILFLVLLGNLNGQIVYSGLQNIVIPTDTFENSQNGIFIDISDPTMTSTTAAALPGWDVNFFYGVSSIITNDTFQPVSNVSGFLEPVLDLPSGGGTIVSSSSTFHADGFSGSNSHMGFGLNQFESGQEGYFGLTYNPDESSTYYGWMRVTFTYGTDGATIHDWAYNTAGNQIAVGDNGLVPEPATYALIVGLFVLVPSVWIRFRNRKR